MSAGGQYTHKQVPDVNNRPVCFEPADGGWTQLVAGFDDDSKTTFTRTVNINDDGNKVVTITSDCDDPTMMLLARKGDGDYWSGDQWRENRQDLILWCSDIALTMLREGLVSTTTDLIQAYGVGVVMSAASNADFKPRVWERYQMTAGIAQIRVVRLLQSMAGQYTDWETKLGGYLIPHGVPLLLLDRYGDVLDVYKTLPQPPWDDAERPWGPQRVAFCAVDQHGDDCFVGENGDLLWRALTETDHHGLSPLKNGGREPSRESYEMFAAAALYDKTAETQITTDLFAGVALDERRLMRDRVLEIFRYALDPYSSARLRADLVEPVECRWTDKQLNRIEGVHRHG